jgi:hypothetical protein
MNTRRAVLEGFIDYAGLFPPAGLDMAATVRNYAAYQRRPDGWALGRLVVPVSRLAEFERELAALPDVDRLGTRWPVTALLGADVERELRVVAEFNERFVHGGPQVVSLEARAGAAGPAAGLRAAVPARLELFLELPLDDRLPTLVAEVGGADARAKIRTGGVNPGDIPSAEAVRRFLDLAASARVPFKATAGLHHPIRASMPLTYESGSPRATMFGYLNLVLAAAARWSGADDQTTRTLLTLEDPSTLTLDDDAVTWDGIRLTREMIAQARRGFVLAMGSCSFTEPLDEVARL